MRKQVLKVLAGAGIAVVIGLGVYFLTRPSDPCALNQGDCPAILGLEKDATLWLTPRQPHPGDVYRVVRNDNVASATLISDYLASRAPVTHPSVSLNRSVSVNDEKGIKASATFLKTFAPGVAVDLDRARSISLEASGAEYQAITSRSAFLTWLQDDVDRKKRDNEDGNNLMAEIRHTILPASAEDGPEGGRYVVTEVLRAATIKYATSDRQTDKAGVDCDEKQECKALNFGRSINSKSGSSINLAKQPIVFWLKMYRIGANPHDRTLIYDERRPGPPMIGQ